jgi:H+/gluconate symporter-like permease
VLGVIGVIAGLALLIILALRGVNVFVASILSAVVVAVFNGMNLAEALTAGYVGAMMRFAGMFFLLFLTGAVFGRVMGESGAANSVALALSRWLGVARTVWIGMLACAILTYGGVNVFIVIFTVYPLGLGLMQRGNVPKRLFVGATALGAGTFTMTALPMSPSIHNVICSTNLGTPLSSGAIIGLIASAIMIVLGMWYLERERKRAEAAGEEFVAAPTDVFPEDDSDESKMPPWVLGVVPLLVVIGTIMIPQLVSKSGLLFEGIQTRLDAEEPGALFGIVEFATTQSGLWAVVALSLGTVVSLVLFHEYLPEKWGVLSRGAESCALPLLNTAAVIGFGGVVKGAPLFAAFADLMINSDLPPALSAAVSVNIMSGIVGSASGGLGIFFDSLAPQYVEAGLEPALLHRLACIASGGLDSLPHSGAVITMLTVMGISHREAYKDIAVVTIVVPLIALAIILAGLLLFT